MNDGACAYTHAVINGRVRVDTNTRAYLHIAPYDHVRANPHILTQSSRRVYHGGRMNERLNFRLRMKENERARICQIRIARAKNCNVLSTYLRVFAYENSGGARALDLLRVAFVG